MNKVNHKNILDLSNVEAREFFLAQERYCTLGLPKYFTFDNILKKISNKINDKSLSCFIASDKKPEDIGNVNYKIFHNKDGEFSWRVFQLIHPVIYVSLVHEITKEKCWNLILNRFKEFQACADIKCASVPIVKDPEQKTEKGEQIQAWWERVEQQSIILSLDYRYVFHTDVVDCYGSIYTHSVAWALHGKDGESGAKNNRKNKDYIGNIIDQSLQQMSYGQTNGIPQGSVLMDFIAEIVLGYADLELSNNIEGHKGNYKIIRYRDDYRIFVNSPEIGKEIIKELTKVLASISMRINSGKTYFSDDIIDSCVKNDKLFWLMNKTRSKSPYKNLLALKKLSKSFPNSGTLTTELQSFYDKKCKPESIRNIDVLISIITDIAYRNTKAYGLSISILGKIISLEEDADRKRMLINKVEDKINTLPNTEMLSLWLQRLTLKSDYNKKYQSKLSQKIYDSQTVIWDSSWLKGNLVKIANHSIIDKEYIKSMDSYPDKEEITIYHARSQYYS